MLDPAAKSSLAVGLGHLVASSPLEALQMQGDFKDTGPNAILGHAMTLFFPVRPSSTARRIARV